MEQNYVVLQGKIFAVTIPAMIGSTNYRWCLKELPKELLLLSTEDHPSGRSNTFMGEQIFYFGAVSAENNIVELGFVLAPVSNLEKTADTYKVQVRIVPSDSEDFIPAEELATVKYGYPCGMEDSNLKYGYPCGAANAQLPFFSPNAQFPFFSPNAQLPFFSPNTQLPFFSPNAQLPFFSADANLKYGYPCGVGDASKAQIPYGMVYNDANLKYGYPCGVEDASKAQIPYGVVYNDANLKYGYPCGAEDANLKYGYPCFVSEASKVQRPYGVVYTDTNLKYGYPGCN